MKIPRKELGQNFLRNQDKIDELIETSQPEPHDIYLEIGPGEGVITKNLAQKVRHIIAVEIDSNLTNNLRSSLKKYKNTEFINEDILRYLNSCYHDSNHGSKFNKIIGSIPYQITSPFLHQLADLITRIKIDSITLLIQKEVANKIIAEAPSASYLSNFVQTFFYVEFTATVPKEVFFPIPKVDGAIVKLQPKTTSYSRRSNNEVGIPTSDSLVGTSGQLLTTNSTEWSAFLHQGFKFPRKMLKKVFDEKILKEAGINPSQRPQEINPEGWLRLYKYTRR